MKVLAVSALLGDPPPARGSLLAARTVLGFLGDGTPYFSPIGQVVADDSRVICHLCGRAYRSVTAHLASHGWTKVQYCQAFGLERGQSLEGAETRKLRATAFSARLVFEPAVRAGSAVGRGRARTGYATIGSLVLDKVGAGQSLAAISRECGLNKDWMARHLYRIDPAAAEFARSRQRNALDARWLPVVRGLGFEDVDSYLRKRHVVEHASVNAIAREVGVSFHAAKAALQRHEVRVSPHVTKRRLAALRREEVAAALGAPSIAEYARRRREQGWTWRQIATEAGQPETWLRRQAL